MLSTTTTPESEDVLSMLFNPKDTSTMTGKERARYILGEIIKLVDGLIAELHDINIANQELVEGFLKELREIANDQFQQTKEANKKSGIMDIFKWVGIGLAVLATVFLVVIPVAGQLAAGALMAGLIAAIVQGLPALIMLFEPMIAEAAGYESVINQTVEFFVGVLTDAFTAMGFGEEAAMVMAMVTFAVLTVALSVAFSSMMARAPQAMANMLGKSGAAAGASSGGAATQSLAQTAKQIIEKLIEALSGMAGKFGSTSFWNFMNNMQALLGVLTVAITITNGALAIDLAMVRYELDKLGIEQEKIDAFVALLEDVVDLVNGEISSWADLADRNERYRDA